MRNELTSTRVGKIASRILKKLRDCGEVCENFPLIHLRETICKVSEIKALAASCLTQSADKPKRKRTKNVKRSK